MCSRHLFVALAAALCLAGVARAVDVPKNVDFSFEDLPKSTLAQYGLVRVARNGV